MNLFAINVFLCFVFIFPGTKQGEGERRLIKVLFSDYEALERPVIDDVDALEVQFSLTLQQIIDVDERAQVIITNIWLNLNWHDYRLKWEPANYSNITVVNMPLKQVWRPDVLMYNSVDVKYDSTFPANVVIEHTGKVKWVPPGLFRSGCNFDIKWFPFDEQQCELKFVSWSNDGTRINLTLEGATDDVAEGDTSTFIKNGEWDLLGLPAKRTVKFYEDEQIIPWIDVAFYIQLRRRPLYYFFNLVVPSVFLSAIAVLTFALPVESGEKVSLGVTILLSLTVFLLLVADTLPPTSDAVPLLGIYFAGTMILCSLSVLFTVLVLNFFSRRPETHEMPKWVKVGICCWLAWLLRMERPGHDLTRRGLTKSRHLHMLDRTSKSLLANVLDLDDDIRCILNANFRNRCPLRTLSTSSVPEPYDSQGDDDVESGTRRAIRCRLDKTKVYYEARAELEAILHELKTITNKLRENEENEEEESDWKYAAMVIDRLCLYVFAVITFLETWAIFLSAPNAFASSP